MLQEPKGNVTRPRFSFSTERGDKGSLTADCVLCFRMVGGLSRERRSAFMRTATERKCLVVALEHAETYTQTDRGKEDRDVNVVRYAEEYAVYGTHEVLHALYIERMEDVAQVEQFIGVRIPVIASGAADSNATQRQQYKDVVREQRMNKAARVVGRDSRHTGDDRTGVLGCGDWWDVANVYVRYLTGSIGSGAYQVQLRLFWLDPACVWVPENNRERIAPMEEHLARTPAARRKARMAGTRARVAEQQRVATTAMRNREATAAADLLDNE